MQLIKINEAHYIVVDNSEIKEGDWFYYKHFGDDVINQANETSDLVNLNKPDRFFKKITHSTMTDKVMENVILLSQDEVEEFINIGKVN